MVEGAATEFQFFRPAPAATVIAKVTGMKYIHDVSMGQGRHALQKHRPTLQTSTPQTHKGTHVTCLTRRREEGGVGGKERERGRGGGGERSRGRERSARTHGHRAGPGLKVSQMMARENLNKGDRHRREAAAESCGGRFPRSVATTRDLGAASSGFPTPPRQRWGPAGERKRKL